MRLDARVTGLAMLILAAAACDFGERSVGTGREQVAVHAVLDPGELQQTILVERTLTGAASPTVGAYDPLDPIVTAGGLPISGARVVVVGPGDSAIAIEDLESRGDGRGAGVYRFRNYDVAPGPDDGIRLVPGTSYQLRVTTLDGRTVTGTTTIPGASSVNTPPIGELFNRDHDSLFVFWPEATQLARYAIRIETPRGPFETYVDSAEYLLSGALRHTELDGLPRVFVPGFRQRITIGAVDQNYLDYYRSESSPYTGRGLLMHLDGGVGVFGSWVTLHRRLAIVTADVDLGIEGSYLPIQAPTDAPRQITVYVDALDGAFGRLSGSWIASPSQPSSGVLGTLRGSQVTLAFLTDQTAKDTAYTLDGRIEGREIVGTLRESGAHVIYQQP